MLAPVKVNTPVELSAADVDRAIELRSTYGMNAERSFVDALYADPVSFEAEYATTGVAAGMWFTPEERDAVLARVDAEWWAYQADQAVSALLGNRYAGTSVEGARVVVRCVGCDPKALSAELRRGLGYGGFENGSTVPTEVKPVEYGGEELTALVDKAIRNVREAGVEVHTGYVDVERNRVVLLAPSPDSASRELRDSRVLFELSSGPEVPAVNKDFALGFNLVEGGQAIGSAAGVGCTSGFAVQSGFGPFILTAAHCSSPALNVTWGCQNHGQDWFQGGLRLGVQSACHSGGPHETLLISTFGVRNNIGRVHFTFTDDMHPITFLVNGTHLLVGQTVCGTGRTTTGISGNLNPIARCGTVSTQTWTGSYPGATSSMGRCLCLAAPGDSGGAVVWPTGYGFGAAGVTSGFIGGTNHHSFSRMVQVSQHWGLTLSPW